MRFADIDLSKLPAPNAIKVFDYDNLLDQMKTELIAYGDAIDFDFRPALEIEADVTLKLLQAVVAREMKIRADMNDQVKAVMPAFAVDNDLEHMAARNGVERKITYIDDPNSEGLIEIIENDDNLRARMQLANEAFSIAGPEGAYLFHLLAVQGVKDGQIYSHEDELLDADNNELLHPAEILAVVLSHDNNGIADEALLAKVYSEVGAKDKRPLGDRLIVEGCTIEDYQIDVELIVYSGPDASIAQAEALKNITRYTDDRYAVARSILRTGIAAASHIEGAVEDVIINSPATDIITQYNQAARCTGINITTKLVKGTWNG